MSDDIHGSVIDKATYDCNGAGFAVLANAVDLPLCLVRGGRVIEANRSFASLTGFSLEELAESGAATDCIKNLDAAELDELVNQASVSEFIVNNSVDEELRWRARGPGGRE